MQQEGRWSYRCSRAFLLPVDRCIIVVAVVRSSISYIRVLGKYVVVRYTSRQLQITVSDSAIWVVKQHNRVFYIQRKFLPPKDGHDPFGCGDKMHAPHTFQRGSAQSLGVWFDGRYQ